MRLLLTDPFRDPTIVVWAVMAVAIGAMVVAVVRWRPPAVLVIYTLGILASLAFSGGINGFPRYSLAAVPLLIGAARLLRGLPFSLALSTSSAVMAVLGFVYASSPVLIP